MAGKVYDGERNEGNRERNTGNREQGIEALYSHTRDPERDARFRVPRSRFPVPGSPFPVPLSVHQRPHMRDCGSRHALRRVASLE